MRMLLKWIVENMPQLQDFSWHAGLEKDDLFELKSDFPAFGCEIAKLKKLKRYQQISSTAHPMILDLIRELPPSISEVRIARESTDEEILWGNEKELISLECASNLLEVVKPFVNLLRFDITLSDYNHFFTKLMEAFSQHKQLEELNIMITFAKTFPFLTQILKNFSHLQELRLSFWPDHEDKAINWEYLENSKLFLEELKNLTCLKTIHLSVVSFSEEMMSTILLETIPLLPERIEKVFLEGGHSFKYFSKKFLEDEKEKMIAKMMPKI